MNDLPSHSRLATQVTCYFYSHIYILVSLGHTQLIAVCSCWTLNDREQNHNMKSPINRTTTLAKNMQNRDCLINDNVGC